MYHFPNPYRKTTFISFFFSRFYAFYILYQLLHYCPIPTVSQTLDICRDKHRISYNVQTQCPLLGSWDPWVQGWSSAPSGVARPLLPLGPAPSRNHLFKKIRLQSIQFLPCPAAESRNRLMYSGAEAPCSGHAMPCGASPIRRRLSPLAWTGLVGFILHPWARPLTILTQ